ncbi:MAG TPA: amidohydrolase family protein [Streptosporangiaceae bacterium]|jgi:L-fuconolactonase|nr:amidohydrolase family protein [Streptosporangiaceae bacterium]
MTIVDAHHHVWDLSVRDQPWLDQPGLAPLRRNFLLSDLEPEAAAHDVTATVLVQTVAEPEETPEMLALAAGSDLIAGVVGWVDLEAPDVTDALAALRAAPGGEFLVGIRHPVLVEPDQDWLARPAVLRGLAAVAAAGLVFDVVVQPRHLAAAVPAAQATPQLTLVLDHFGNPDIDAGGDEAWTSAFSAFAALPNTVGKFSGILGEPAPGLADAAGASGPGPGRGSNSGAGPDSGPVQIAHLQPYYDLALGVFGPRRLMFGSDWPVSTMMIGYDGVYAAARALTAGLSPAENAAIFRETAVAAYGLALAPPA